MKRLVVHIVLSLFIPCFGWANTADEPIPLEYFGLHMHRADQGTAWPNVPFGSWRLWDAYVSWSQLEPKKGQWDFSRLDRYVAMAKIGKVDLLLPLASTPRWAASRADEPSGYRPGNASEPQRIEDWRTYVRTLGERYKGRITLYEIWNEPNIKHHFSGSPEKLVELTCEAYRILKDIDPANRVVSPSATAGAKDHIQYLENFLTIGGKKCIDIVGHHFYVPNSGPEAMVPLIRQVRAIMQKHGIDDKPLWNTETGWWTANYEDTLDQPMVGWKKLSLNQQSGDYLLHAFLLARAEGVGRFYWYAWDNRSGLGMLDAAFGTPKPIVESWRDAVSVLLGASRPDCKSVGDNWRCTFRTKAGAERVVSWQAN